MDDGRYVNTFVTFSGYVRTKLAQTLRFSWYEFQSAMALNALARMRARVVATHAATRYGTSWASAARGLLARGIRRRITETARRQLDGRAVLFARGRWRRTSGARLARFLARFIVVG